MGNNTQEKEWNLVFPFRASMSGWLLFNVNLSDLFNYIMARTSYIKWWWCLLCTRPKHLVEFNRASSLKQQSVSRHVAPYGYNILIPTQPVFAYIPLCCVFCGEATHINFIVRKRWQQRGKLHPSKYLVSVYITSRSFPHSWPITGFVTRLTRRVPLVEQELPTLPEHLSLLPVFIGVLVTRSLVLCVCFVDRCLSFCSFTFGHRVFCSSSISGFLLSLWYLQTLLEYNLLVVEE